MRTETPSSPGAAAPELGYRPELDGMRALAVGVVVFFHSYTGLFKGGWLGVDVFFVLSGFLITALLLREHDRLGSIGLRAFYARRALRLFPALAVLLVALAVGVVVSGGEASTLNGIPWTIAYVNNWARMAGHEFGPLDHLWSLSVEEQFYLVWPVVLLGLVRFRRREVAFGITLALAVSVTLARTGLRYTDVVDRGHAYVGSDLRADALLYGCAVGIAFHLGWLHPLRRWFKLAALPAVAFLVLLALSPIGPAHGLAAYLYGPIDVAAAVIVAFVLTSAGSVGWLTWRPLVRMGVVSYGIYLWHYPVMWTLAERFDQDPVVVLAVGAPLAVALALASFRFVEAPCLRLKGRFDRFGRGATGERVEAAL